MPSSSVLPSLANPSPQQRQGLALLSVLGAAVLWGTTGTAASFASAVGPLAIGAAAMGIGGLLQALLALRQMAASRARLRAHWPHLLLGALAVAVYPLAFYASMRLAGVAIGTVISIGSAPLASALIERVMEGQRLSRRWLGAFALGVAGMAILGFAKSGAATAAQVGLLRGLALGLLAGLTYALYSWAARQLMHRGVAPRAAMGAVFGAGGLLLLPVLLATGAPLLASWGHAAVGLYMALVPMFAGYLLFGYGLARIQASTAITLTLLEPVVAALLAVWIVGERLPASGWLGMALIMACLLVTGWPRRQA